jgi:hypothetical protein
MTQPDSAGVLLRDPHARIVGEDAELVEADLSGRCRSRLYALHDADAVVGIDDFLSDLEVQEDLSFRVQTRGWLL